MAEVAPLLEKFPECRVLVVGDLMADKYVWTEAHFPPSQRPPILKSTREDYALGGAANVAHNLIAFGAEVYLCGLVGYDDAAHWFRRGCNEAGIKTSGVFPVSDRPTTQKVRVMSADGSSPLIRLDYEVTDPPTDLETASMRTYIEHYMPLVDAVVLSDYDKGIFGHVTFAREILDRARELEKFTVVESKAHLFKEIRGARLVILSDDQAETYFLKEVGSVPMETETTGFRVRGILGCEVLAILRADRELWVFYAEAGEERYTVVSIDDDKVLDPTGVKDTVTGTLALGFVAGADIRQAAHLAIRAAEAVVQRVGTATIRLEELLRSL